MGCRTLTIALLLSLTAGTHSWAAPPDPASPAAATAADQAFDVLEFRVLGNTVLQPIAVERAVYPYTGPKKTFKDVQAAGKALESVYHAAGYGTVFVDVPEQDVGDGIVRLRVSEGRIDRIHVNGAHYFSNRKLLAALPSLQRGAVPQLPALQSQLGTINTQSADRSVTPILKAGRTPGTVDVDLNVKDEAPLHGGVTLNDRYTADTTHLRSTLDLSYGNLFQDFHTISVEWQAAPESLSDAKVYALTYTAPIDAARDLISVYAIRTDSDVAAIGTLDVLGNGHIFGAHFIHPFASTRLIQNLNVGVDFKDFSQTINLQDNEPDKTPIRYMNWSLAYSLADRAAHHATLVSVTANLGLSGLVNKQEQFAYKRFDGKADYAYLRMSLEHQRPLLWGTSLDARFMGQLSGQPLIDNEQFGIGGVDTVRGYTESFVLGDSGIAGAFEVHGPSWRLGGDPTANNIYLLAFYDAGLVAVSEPLPTQTARLQLESTGLGFRLVALRHLEGALDWAYPLRTEGRIQRGESRIHFQLRYGF
jgi:hemolysin activation/secretion protein